MDIFTIGFTQKSAQEFFTRLRQAGVQLLVDIRLNPQGQLAGFAKQEDLPYFLNHLAAGCCYIHLPQLAPTKELLETYRQNKNWQWYEQEFEVLMDARDIPASLDRKVFETTRCCLLCSEDTPEKCHRRLVAERLSRAWGGMEIKHL